MEKTLPRICRTFWGPALAPFMQTVLSSGVMPDYILDPAKCVRYFNKVRRDPLYDPCSRTASALKGSLPPVVDTPEMMLAQVRAAERCVAVLEEGCLRLDGLDRYRRKYFMGFYKFAPFWLATARTRYHVRRANALAGEGRNAEALHELEEGRRRMESDYDRAESLARRMAGEPDARGSRWPFDRTKSRRLVERAAASAKVVLHPRPPGDGIRIAIHKGSGAAGTKAYLERFGNVRVDIIDSIALAVLEPYDCVFLPNLAYDKSEFFMNVRRFVEQGGRGVYFEGPLCGHRRWDRSTPFPEVVETSPERVENLSREMTLADGRRARTMYVDFFALEPGARGEVRAYGPDGKTPLAVRGAAGLGRVFFNGTYNVGSVSGTYATEEVELYGGNAALVREAVEYFTGRRLDAPQL